MSQLSKSQDKPRFRTRDGRWTVESISLRYVPSPRQWGDPAHGDGEYLFARGPGQVFYASSVEELAEMASQWGAFELTDLEEVK